MSSHAEGNVTTVVIQMEPGLVFVKVADPKPAPDRMEYFLRRTIEDWFAARPTFVIDRDQAVVIDDELLGIHVWYHVAAASDRSATPPTPLPDTFTIEVHAKIATIHSKEYIEAVLADGMQILPAYEHRRDTLVVVNPRRIAVLLDKQALRGAVIPVDLIEQIVTGPMKTRLQTWLAKPASPFYVMHIAGSWFGRG